MPVDGERRGGVAAAAGLGGGVGQQRAQQGEAPGPGTEQQLSGGVAGIDVCSSGSRFLLCRLSWIGSVMATSVTVAAVVAT